MQELELIRVSYSHIGTFGVLLYGKIPFCVTLEPLWVNNLADYSCIPEGKYVCKRVDSPTYGTTFEVTGVDGRTHVLFHWGNIVDDTIGCILLGEEFGILADDPAILSSKKAFSEFLQRFGQEEEIILNITSVTGYSYV